MSWLPTRIALDAAPQVVPGGQVEWMDFGSRPLTDPFLSQTISALRMGHPPARELQTNLSVLLRAAARFPELEPAGFIFHSSRCGSTLVANAVRTDPGVMGVSEPLSLANLFRRWRDTGHPYLDSHWRAVRKNAATAVLTLFGHHPEGRARRIIVKFPSVTTIAMAQVRELFPRVPCLMMVRDPVEILVSALDSKPGQGKGGWMRFQQSPEQAQAVFAWDLERPTTEMTPEEFGARVQGRYLECALEGLESAGGPLKLVDYRNLTEATILEIGRFFGCELDRAALAPVLGTHSKEATKKLTFSDDRARKRELATPLLVAASNHWASANYQAVLRWSRGRGL